MISLPDLTSMQAALDLPLDPQLRRLLSERIEQLAPAGGPDLSRLTHFLVVEPGDEEADIEREVGFSPLVNPIDGSRFGSRTFHPWWDWLQDHGGWFELVVTVGNGGFAYVLFIQDGEGTLPDLLSLCRTCAE